MTADTLWYVGRGTGVMALVRLRRLADRPAARAVRRLGRRHVVAARPGRAVFPDRGRGRAVPLRRFHPGGAHMTVTDEHRVTGRTSRLLATEASTVDEHLQGSGP